MNGRAAPQKGDFLPIMAQMSVPAVVNVKLGLVTAFHIPSEKALSFNALLCSRQTLWKALVILSEFKCKM